eukprot:1138831-Pelagomonas_calceolata.AAC.5
MPIKGGAVGHFWVPSGQESDLGFGFPDGRDGGGFGAPFRPGAKEVYPPSSHPMVQDRLT